MVLPGRQPSPGRGRQPGHRALRDGFRKLFMETNLRWTDPPDRCDDGPDHICRREYLYVSALDPDEYMVIPPLNPDHRMRIHGVLKALARGWAFACPRLRQAQGRERLRGRLIRLGVAPLSGAIAATLTAERAAADLRVLT